MGEEKPPPSGDPYPFWEDWFKVAEILNYFVHWLVIGLAVLVFIFQLLVGTTLTIVNGIITLIFGVASGVLYFIFVYKQVKDKDLTLMMHIMLIVCTVLAYIASWWAGIWWMMIAALAMTAQLIFVGVLSDRPFWVAFSEGS